MDEWNLKMNKLEEDVINWLEPYKMDKVKTYALLGYLVFEAMGKKLIAFYGFNGSLVILEESFKMFDRAPKQ